MKRIWLLLGLIKGWAQVEMADSLRAVLERDVRFDILVSRSFPVLLSSTDTFPLSPLLSGSARIGLSWRWGLGKQTSRRWFLTLAPLFLFEKATFRATSASVVPGLEVVSDAKYLWFKYRSGALMLQSGFRLQPADKQSLFPRWWIEAGLWAAYRIGRSLKYIVDREGRVERARVEGNPHLASSRGGFYARVGRQWLFLEGYYHLLAYFREGTYGEAPARRYPMMPRWEVGVGIAL